MAGARHALNRQHAETHHGVETPGEPIGRNTTHFCHLSSQSHVDALSTTDGTGHNTRSICPK